MTRRKKRPTIGEQIAEGLVQAVAYERGEITGVRTKVVASGSGGARMLYYGIITREGDRILVEFPDAPGCQTFADRGEDIRELAQEALEGWLEAHLVHGEAPPAPSG